MAELKGTNLEEAVRWVCELLAHCLMSFQLPILFFAASQCLAVRLLSLRVTVCSTDLHGFELHTHTWQARPSLSTGKHWQVPPLCCAATCSSMHQRLLQASGILR